MKMYFRISMVVFALVSLVTSAKAGLEGFEGLEFDTVVSSLKTRQAIEVNGKEYLVLKEEPKLRSAAYNRKKVSTNPCYPESRGLGPKLLKLSDIDNLPQEARFFFHSVVSNKVEGIKYVTVRYTSNDNPHWGLMHTFPETFKEPENRYWQDEHTKDCVKIERTVNFLLQKVS